MTGLLMPSMRIAVPDRPFLTATPVTVPASTIPPLVVLPSRRLAAAAAIAKAPCGLGASFSVRVRKACFCESPSLHRSPLLPVCTSRHTTWRPPRWHRLGLSRRRPNPPPETTGLAADRRAGGFRLRFDLRLDLGRGNGTGVGLQIRGLRRLRLRVRLERNGRRFGLDRSRDRGLACFLSRGNCGGGSERIFIGCGRCFRLDWCRDSGLACGFGFGLALSDYGSNRGGRPHRLSIGDGRRYGLGRGRCVGLALGGVAEWAGFLIGLACGGGGGLRAFLGRFRSSRLGGRGAGFVPG